MILVTTAVAHAQGDAPQAAPVRLGPVALAPTVTSNFGWDSNVFLSPEGQREEDFTAVVRPDVQSWLRVGPARVRGGTKLAWIYFREHPSLGSTDWAQDVRVDVPLARITPYVAGRWLSTRERVGYEVDERIRREEDNRVAGAVVRIGTRTEVDVAARSSKLKFDDASGLTDPVFYNLVDYTSDGEGVTVRHQLTPLTSLAVILDQHRERFEDAPERDSRSFSWATGFEFQPFALITGSAYVGWVQVDMIAPGSPSFGGVAASVDLGYTLLGATRFAVQASRDVEYSSIRGQQAYLFAGVTGSVNHRLNETWDVGGRVGRSYHTYGLFDEPSLPGGQAADDAYQEKITDYHVDLSYRLGPDTRVGCAVGLVHRDSNLAGFRAYDWIMAGVTVGYRF